MCVEKQNTVCNVNRCHGISAEALCGLILMEGLGSFSTTKFLVKVEQFFKDM